MPEQKTPEEQLNDEMLSLYRRTNEATGYRPSYFLRSVRTEGGLGVARKLLAQKKSVGSGFDRLVEAQRADLSVEHVVLQARFSPLFTVEELNEARRRLAPLPPEAFPNLLPPLQGAAEEVDEDGNYVEGAVKQVTINAYERSPAARAACVRHHGCRCSVCGLDFEKTYGEIGRGFIHVHHKKPLSRLKAANRLDAKRDLVPVCPNCHAMLHRRSPPLDIEQLRALLEK